VISAVIASFWKLVNQGQVKSYLSSLFGGLRVRGALVRIATPLVSINIAGGRAPGPGKVSRL
jgi:hypothetical protein